MVLYLVETLLPLGASLYFCQCLEHYYIGVLLLEHYYIIIGTFILVLEHYIGMTGTLSGLFVLLNILNCASNKHSQLYSVLPFLVQVVRKRDRVCEREKERMREGEREKEKGRKRARAESEG